MTDPFRHNLSQLAYHTRLVLPEAIANNFLGLLDERSLAWQPTAPKLRQAST
ncbi:MAG TPA: hypothetical protein V6D16_15520 [Candidatus Obscuribacterales bacterium]